MPFPIKNVLIITNNPKCNVKYSCRKEKGFALTYYNVIPCPGKASASVSFEKMKGSITVEAALSIPLFLFAALSLIWLLEMHSIQTAVRCAMQAAGKRAAQEFYMIPYLSTEQLHTDMVQNIGRDRIEQSMIEGGGDGLHCEKSRVSFGNGVLELQVEYYLKLPVPVFVIPAIPCKEQMRMKTWTGYTKQGFEYSENEKTVYVAETGVVYHLDYHCTYLEPSIRTVDAGEIDGIRNQSHGKYYPCERCMRKAQQSGAVYITDYGDRYHSSLGCSGLKRKIYAVPMSEAGGKRPCSKCGTG